MPFLGAGGNAKLCCGLKLSEHVEKTATSSSTMKNILEMSPWDMDAPAIAKST